MNMLGYPSTNDDIFRICIKECGIITSTEDKQYFALGCIICPEKFLYFDAFIEHMQTVHVTYDNNGSSCGREMYGRNINNEKNILTQPQQNDVEEDLTALVMIKDENVEGDDDNGALIQNEPLVNVYKQEHNDPEVYIKYIGSYQNDYASVDDL